MKNLQRFILVSVITLIASATYAAPVGSVESTQTSAHRQKLDAFLSETAVVNQLSALGLSQAEIQFRVAQLSDTQLAAAAAEIDLLQAGGTIQGGNPRPGGPIGCIFKPIGRFFYNIYTLIFCWGRFNID